MVGTKLFPMTDQATDTQTPAPNVLSAACSSRVALQEVTGRWGGLTILALEQTESPLRFSEIRRQVEGVSDRMLSQTLSKLERDGMIERTVHSSIPPHVNYHLTPLGLKIAEPLRLLAGTVEAELAKVLEAQEEFDVKHQDD